MTQGNNIERLLERYVNGDLSEPDRRLVEQYLTGTGSDSARAREDLRFEHALTKALSIAPFEDDVAGAVLDRVFRRPTRRTRKTYQDGLATQAFQQALEKGRISAPRRRFLSRRVHGLIRTAAIFLIAVSGAWWLTNQSGPRERPHRPAATAADTVARVAYVKESDAEALKAVSADAGSELESDHEVSTDDAEVAVVNLTIQGGGGRIAVLPQSRIRLSRSRPGAPVLIVLEQGGIRFDFRQRKRPMEVMTAQGHRGKLRGAGEVVMVSRAIGESSSSLVPASDQMILARMESSGDATFRSSRGRFQVRAGETGVVGADTALKVTETPRGLDQMARAEWTLSSAIDDPAGTAMITGARTFTREEIAREAMRVYAFELFEMLSQSMVIQWELRRQGIELTEANLAEARQIVRASEALQVAPLRSAAAENERVTQVAGLLALHRGSGRSSPRWSIPLQDCQRTWNLLARSIRFERDPSKPEVMVRLSFRGQSVDITRTDAWNGLRQLLRTSELDQVMSDLAEREQFATMLQRQGRPFPEVDLPLGANPLQDTIQAALARMAGMTLVQLRDRKRLVTVMLPLVPVPSAAEVDRFMQENVSMRRQLMFDHYFFPFADAATGAFLGKEAFERARRAAKELVSALRDGQSPESPQLPGQSEAESRQGWPWRNGPASGPRPWWIEIYGRKFAATVLDLDTHEVSEPVASAEGFHVAHLHHAMTAPVSPNQHRLQAQMTLRTEQALLYLERHASQHTRYRVPAAELLN